MIRTIIWASAIAICLAVMTETADAGWRNRQAAMVTQSTCWHGPYYYVPWGTPTALVVPPTVASQTHWGWGVGNTRVTPVYHQFQRDWPGPAGSAGPFRPTPHWPSDTDQFGVHYVRGPW
jgi:hypothetical protein